MARRSGRPLDAPHAEDAFGEMVWDYYHDDLAERPVYRRDDGEVTEAHLGAYFTDPGEWGETFRRRLEELDGRVLDVGCGAGKHASYLQEQGGDVLAVDRSPGAVAVARERGVDHAATMDMRDLGVLAGFDGVLVAGKQVTVGDDPDDLRSTLETLAATARPGARLLADFDAPERRGDGYLDDHLLDDGPASRRFRVEYDGLTGPWVDVLMLEYDTLEGIVSDVPWRIVSVEGREDEGSDYLVSFERTG